MIGNNVPDYGLKGAAVKGIANMFGFGDYKDSSQYNWLDRTIFNRQAYNNAFNAELMANDLAFQADQARMANDLTLEQNALDRAMSYDLFERGNAFNAEQNKIRNELDLFMSNTAYQRAVEDMKKAGLNPYLFYANNTGGASTPVLGSASAYGVSQNTGHSFARGSGSRASASNQSNVLGAIGYMTNSALTFVSNMAKVAVWAKGLGV